MIKKISNAKIKTKIMDSISIILLFLQLNFSVGKLSGVFTDKVLFKDWVLSLE